MGINGCMLFILVKKSCVNRHSDKYRPVFKSVTSSIGDVQTAVHEPCFDYSSIGAALSFEYQYRSASK